MTDTSDYGLGEDIFQKVQPDNDPKPTEYPILHRQAVRLDLTTVGNREIRVLHHLVNTQEIQLQVDLVPGARHVCAATSPVYSSKHTSHRTNQINRHLKSFDLGPIDGWPGLSLARLWRGGKAEERDRSRSSSLGRVYQLSHELVRLMSQVAKRNCIRSSIRMCCDGATSSIYNNWQLGGENGDGTTPS